MSLKVTALIDDLKTRLPRTFESHSEKSHSEKPGLGAGVDLGDLGIISKSNATVSK